MRSLKSKYYIVRHGETFASRDGVPYGEKQEEAEILPEAFPPIIKLSEYLRTVHTDLNYTSPKLRCLQTSQIITEHSGKVFEKLPLLDEYLEPTFEEFKKRIKKTIEKLESQEGKTYLLCTHGGVISALKHLLIFDEYEEKDLLDYPVTGTLMIINSSGSEIIDFNK